MCMGSNSCSIDFWLFAWVFPLESRSPASITFQSVPDPRSRAGIARQPCAIVCVYLWIVSKLVFYAQSTGTVISGRVWIVIIIIIIITDDDNDNNNKKKSDGMFQQTVPNCRWDGVRKRSFTKHDFCLNSCEKRYGCKDKNRV